MATPYRYVFATLLMAAAFAPAASATQAATPAPAAAPAPPPVVETLDSDEVVTRFGTLTVVDHPTGMRTLALDGKVLFDELDNDLLGFYALIRAPHHDTVLAWADCSGSSCGYPMYYLIELSHEHAPWLLTADGFMGGDVAEPTEDNLTPTLSVQADGSVLIATAGDAPEHFVYRDGAVTAVTAVTAPPHAH